MTVLSAADVAQFKASARTAFGTQHGTGETRARMATTTGWDAAAWRRLARELGVAGLMVPETYGGAGMTASELAFVFEEAGAALLCAPLFATAALAVPLLLELGDESALTDFGPAICEGDLIATVALAEDDGRWSAADVRTSADLIDGRWYLSGGKNYVVDGLGADLLLVVAATPVGVAAFAVTATDSPTLTRTPLVTMDQTRKMARLVFDRTPARLLGSDSASTEIARATDIARCLLAAEQTGGAQRCLDMTVDYARTRIQFGRPIGSFQAVKQRLADMLIKVESSRSGAYHAAATPVDDPEFGTNARIAALTAIDAYEFASAQTIQLHGGIGFTWEHDAHLFFKRARASAILLGSESDHLNGLARIIDSRPA